MPAASRPCAARWSWRVPYRRSSAFATPTASSRCGRSASAAATSPDHGPGRYGATGEGGRRGRGVVGGARRGPQAAGVERADGRQVRDGRVEVGGGGQGLVE